jgi:hypothetical protein
MTEETITIDIDDEPHGEAPGDAVGDLKGQVAALQRQAAAEKARADRVERDNYAAQIRAGRENAQYAAQAAAAEFASAAEEGDFTRQADAQRRIARAEAEALRLQEAEAGIPRQTQVSGDPIEAAIASRTPQTQAWFRSHPDQARAFALLMTGQASGDDLKRARKLSAAHEDALAEGYTADSPEYFGHVEKFIGITGERQRRSSPPAAPVSGASWAGGGSRGGTQVTLTAGEAAAATDGTHVWGRHDLAAGRIKDASQIGQPIGHREMGRRKLALQREGAYDRGS